MIASDRLAWMTAAACRAPGIDAGVFFPGRGEDTNAAKKICATCRVRAQCLDYAMASPREKHGIWGGLSERGRRSLARRQARARRAVA